jgi:G:T-mismatch repair DNA endonuclease (very short patch repair protein)
MTKICLYCNKSFTIHISRKDTAKFCSISCSKKYAWKQPEFRLNIINKLKGRHLSPETEIKKGQHLSLQTEIKPKEHLSNSTEFKTGNIPLFPYTSSELKQLWKNQNYKEYIIKKILSAAKNKPNKQELKLSELLPPGFEYVGNGKVIIGGLNPDFIDIKNKKIIELYGDYWHNKKEAIERDILRIPLYTEYGYSTLIVWEHEFNCIIDLKARIERFIHDS